MLHKNNTILIHDETSTRNSDPGSGIYLTADKVLQCRLVDKNSIEREEAKKETDKTSTRKLHLQQNRSEASQKCQDSMDRISSSPTE